MNRTNDTASPVNPLPAVVVALFLTLLGIELVFTLGARGLVGGPDAVQSIRHRSGRRGPTWNALDIAPNASHHERPWAILSANRRWSSRATAT